jgi:toxin ParE1/3/4
VSLPVFILPEAEADLAAIRAHLLCVYAESAAERFKPAVQEAAQFLGQWPFAGRCRHFRTPGLRSWQVPGFERYLIFYRVTDDRLDIVRVLYGMRDLPRYLGPASQTPSAPEKPQSST